MVSIDVDPSKQLLIIQLAETVGVGEAETAVERVKRCLEKLETGFHQVTDLSDLDCMEDECAPFVIQIMDLCAEKGISSVYRIMPDSKKDIGFNIMSRFHYGRDVHIVTFENRQEAEEAIADL